MLATMERTDTRGTQRPQPREVLDLLEQFGSTISVQHDREIHGEGDTAEFCYRVVAGCVRIVKLMEDGRRQICEFLMAGDLLGFDALDCFDFTAEAVSDVVLRRYPRRTVDALASTNLTLARRPQHLANLSFAITPIPDWLIEPRVTFVSKRYNGAKEVDPLSPYARVDIYTEYRFLPNWKTFLRAENVLNEHYQEVLNYGTTGPAVYAGLSGTW